MPNDPRSTNLSKEILTCRVCGLVQADPPWGVDGTSPSFQICPCCGCEFGYDDATWAGVVRHREIWLQTGGAWLMPDERPVHWSLIEQMQNIPEPFRGLPV